MTIKFYRKIEIKAVYVMILFIIFFIIISMYNFFYKLFKQKKISLDFIRCNIKYNFGLIYRYTS
jgi:hypothetical protein